MNKPILILILGVVLLGMGLLLVQQYQEGRQPPMVAESSSGTPQEAPAQAAPPQMPSQPPQPAAAQQQMTPQQQQQLAQQQQMAQQQQLAQQQAAQQAAQQQAAQQAAQQQAAQQAAQQKAAQQAAQQQAAQQQAAQQQSAQQAAQQKAAQQQAQQQAAQQQAAQQQAAQQAAQQQAAQHKATQAGKQAATPTTAKLVVSTKDTGANVRLSADAPISYKTTLLSSPFRATIDLDGQWPMLKAPGVNKGNPVVTNVRMGNWRGGTQVVIDLKVKCKLTPVLSKNGTVLDLRIDP
ncbi:MAG: AMIN domain-containing protein [Desulfovibrio sp.]|nr:AMIN domain-containing protein [Desulfovibrio sp.]